ncbi:GOLPH3/VPS74 family protein [Catenuloplanes indicus]|uniref:Uncharacterized protein n=1 Tax=Catenuloplanes indicus TaxID=137267 RepID=A0AAE3W048_9ACTN|nr:GPP34 family phosphoprotein [Catenuloplanes indicus]MDQ0366939.1 hypothetical protein [Catenuloplanes indicus]
MLIPAVGSRGAHKQAAVDFWWLAHRDGTGASVLHRSITSIGLAAALLWDMRDQLFITADGIAVIDERVSAEPTEQGLLSRLVAEGTAHPPGTWLDVVAADGIYDQTARRLINAGQVKAVGWPRKRYPYVGADPTRAAWPAGRLMSSFRLHGQFEDDDLILVALVLACGLDEYVFYDDHAQAVAQARREVRRGDQVLQTLYVCTEAAVAKAVTVRR